MPSDPHPLPATLVQTTPDGPNRLGLVMSDSLGDALRFTMDLEMSSSGPLIVLRPLVPLMVKSQRKKYAKGLRAALG